MLVTTMVSFLISLAAPAQAGAGDIDERQKPQIDAATAALSKGQPQLALDTIEPVISAYQASLSGEKRRLYCGLSGAETIAYLGLPLRGAPGSVALAPGYCDALFLKGFALIDLNRVAEARTIYGQVIALAPFHAHFYAELGQSYRLTRDWPKMLELCTTAAGFADLADKDRVGYEKGLAWRCMGYALIEQGKFDEAEKLYRQCLEVDPNDAKAKNELEYISEQRAKKS